MNYFESLPWHVFEKIIYESINIKECDIQYNNNLRLVCKHWNNLLSIKNFFKLYSKKIKLNIGRFDNISIYNYIKKIIKENRYEILKSNNSNKDQQLILDEHLIHKLYLNKEFLKKIHINQYALKYIPSELIIITEYIINENKYANDFDVINLPVCYFKDSRCIDNVCGIDCANNYHGLLNYTNHYISRGIDDKGRFYLLFFYKDFEKDRIFYEFIYTISLNIYTNSKILTYSGYNNNCYIGNLSNYYDPAYPYFKRRIRHDSFDYAIRLMNFKKCGFVEYDNDEERYFEYNFVKENNSDIDIDIDNSDTESVSNSDSDNDQLEVCLYFDKDEIQKNINYNKKLYEIINLYDVKTKDITNKLLNKDEEQDDLNSYYELENQDDLQSGCENKLHHDTEFKIKFKNNILK